MAFKTSSPQSGCFVAARLLSSATADLLALDAGHAVRGRAAPAVPVDAIEPYLDRVATLYRRSLDARREHGFLAYAPAAPGAGLVTEPDAAGTADAIRWHWRHPDATVAFSFHTHPSSDAGCVPSGIDALGALIRGDHVVYVLTMDGRLSGWRFRKEAKHPKAVDDAMRALDQAKAFGEPFVAFLYDAFDALRPRLLEPVYAARVKLTDDDGARLTRCEPARPFFAAWECPR